MANKFFLEIFTIICFALFMVSFAPPASAQITITQRSELIAAIQAIQQKIAMLEQLLAQMPWQTGSVNDNGIVNTSTIWQLYPVQADVPSCLANNNKTYSTTGYNSTNWFLWNKCASEKIYPVNGGSTIVLQVWGDNSPNSKCHIPIFTLYENIGGVWQKALDVDMAGYGDSREQNFFYTPVSNQIKITASSCFYLKVYSGDSSALRRYFTEHTDLLFGRDYGSPSITQAPSIPNFNRWISILSPSGGEIWKSSGVYTIMWNSSNIDKVWISIKNDSSSAGAQIKDIAPGFTAVPAAQGYYLWTINDNWLPGGNRTKFKIIISEYPANDAQIVADESSYFTILP